MKLCSQSVLFHVWGKWDIYSFIAFINKGLTDEKSLTSAKAWSECRCLQMFLFSVPQAEAFSGFITASGISGVILRWIWSMCVWSGNWREIKFMAFKTLHNKSLYLIILTQLSFKTHFCVLHCYYYFIQNIDHLITTLSYAIEYNLIRS